MRKYVFLLLVTATLFIIASCSRIANTENVFNAPGADEIHIGVVYPVAARDMDTYLYKGIELAVNHVNEAGGVLGRRLATEIRDDGNDAHLAMQIANTLSQQGITAVIGHWSTDISYFLSEVYETQEVVMITPAASGSNLLLDDHDFIFRMTGHNRAYAEEMAAHLLERGMSRVAVVFGDDSFGRDFAAVLESVLSSHGIVVVDRITSITPASRGAILDRWRAFGAQAIIMGVAMGQIVEPINLIRGTGNMLPILGADSFDRHDLHSALSAHAYAVYRIGISHDSLCGDFLSAFREAYGHDPDIRAVTGYMAVTVLADAMNAMGTTDSEAIVEFLTSMQNHPTIMGPLSYNPDTSEFERIDFTMLVLGGG